ncbi:MAG: hypothetical protein H6737_24350 [Alphaproteobacteria bacterium]|nr:hypothetical protein [Alphaproteobacteria bacterium]
MNALALLLSLGCPKPSPELPPEPVVEAPVAPVSQHRWGPKAEVRGEVDRRFYGEWMLSGSTAKWSIFEDEGRTWILGIDTGDGEQFVVADFVAEGATVRFASQMPSTGHMTEQTWALDDQGRCECRIQGDANVTIACLRPE